MKDNQRLSEQANLPSMLPASAQIKSMSYFEVSTRLTENV